MNNRRQIYSAQKWSADNYVHFRPHCGRKKEICILTLSLFCYKIQIMYGPVSKYTGMTPQNGYSVVFP